MGPPTGNRKNPGEQTTCVCVCVCAMASPDQPVRRVLRAVLPHLHLRRLVRRDVQLLPPGLCALPHVWESLPLNPPRPDAARRHDCEGHRECERRRAREQAILAGVALTMTMTMTDDDDR